MSGVAFQVLKTRALVIGSGISGLFTALKLSEAGVSVLLVTKSSLADNNSRYAQGGIAAVLPSNPMDSLELHVKDTLRAGAGLCDEVVVRSILSEGYLAIEDLLNHGVEFDRAQDKELALTREAAHTVNRILHAGGDATGHSVEMTLIGKVKADPNINVLEYCQVLELLVQDNRCAGAIAIAYQKRQALQIQADFTVLATGGIGRIYSHSTNPPIATGNGIALAYLAGAKIEGMEFVQFHPTAFYADGNLHFLISETLRGEGGILRDTQGRPFASKYHPDGELAPRDIVTRGIYAEMQASGVDHVYLDITHLSREIIERRFPTILENCLRFGVDIRTDYIPVAPAAHYVMGGVAADLDGRSTVNSLYVVGETTHTGLHGANRLASNSLLECVVLARRVAEHISIQPVPISEGLMQLPGELSDYSFEDVSEIQTMLETLHRMMWQNAGILRDKAGLEAALEEIGQLQKKLEEQGWTWVIPHGAELYNQLVVARLICQAALERNESRGAHYRTDYPDAKPTMAQMVSCSVLPQ